MPNLLAQNQLSPELFEILVSEDLDYIDHEPYNFVRRPHENFLFSFKDKSMYIKLIDNIQQDIVAFVKLDAETYFGIEYKVIKLSYAKFTRKGYVRYIYSILLFDFGFHIMSDSLNTIPGSMNFWKKIKQLENSECRVLNISNRYNRLYNTQADHLIWGVDEEYFIDGELNSLFVEDFWSRKIINSDLYNYIIENQNRISDKKDLRLTIKVDSGDE